MTTPLPLLDELESALAAGSGARRDDILSRITDLFLGNASNYSPDQISLFDDVITRLATTIEAKARGRLATRLADGPNAPASVVRMLAFDDDIEVARPVLTRSE